MKRKFALLLLIVLFSISVLTVYPVQDKKLIKNLPDRYREWLEEEVVYIITPTEKKVFLMLANDRERDLFIGAFWKHRDPIPATPENEFKTEHYQRISYANKWFGRGTPTDGWRTDMGRIHIILGEPKTIDRYENLTEVYPTIVWFYQGMGKYGLPESFNVVFFKKYGAGDYETYSPIRDGPQHLLVHYFGDPRDYLRAFQQLRLIQPQLARVSLTLIPSEPLPSVSPSAASEILLSNIDVNPQKYVKDQYAEKLLKYKDIIEVEYSANYIGNTYMVSSIHEKSGICFVHYFIEPERLSVNLIDNKYYTTLEISGHITDTEGKTVYQYNKSIPIEFDEKQLKIIQSKPFRFQDIFPLAEGNYKFNLLLKNRISKEFTSFEKDLFISPSQYSQEMTTLILTPSIKNVPSIESKKSFKVEGVQLFPSARNEFSIHDTLYIFFQTPDNNNELRETDRLEFIFYKEDQEFLRREKEIKAYAKKGQFIEEFSLANFPPAIYRVEVNVFSEENKNIFHQGAFFSVSLVESIPRPFIYSEIAPSSLDPLTDYILGGQYFNKGNYEKAEYFLEKAYRKNPAFLRFAEGFSRILFTKKKFQEVKNILLPFLENPQDDYRFLRLLGQTCQKLGQYGEAIDHYKKYLGHYGTNLEVLNAIGYCYFSEGNKKEALEAWEKSLEINPDQEKIKKMVKSLKGEK